MVKQACESASCVAELLDCANGSGQEEQSAARLLSFTIYTASKSCEGSTSWGIRVRSRTARPKVNLQEIPRNFISKRDITAATQLPCETLSSQDSPEFTGCKANLPSFSKEAAYRLMVLQALPTSATPRSGYLSGCLCRAGSVHICSYPFPPLANFKSSLQEALLAGETAAECCESLAFGCSLRF